ncbi:MAG: hypothetical protein GEU78_05005 [Actinobacteria bacterium]|nr:hypothetical protein [Actinomycetota bacterium]
MKLYAEVPRHRTQQVLNDIFIALWVIVWVRVGVIVHGLVDKLAGPGRSVERAGRRVADGAANVSGDVSDVPLVGDDLASAFDRLSDAGGFLRDAGQSQQDAVHALALWLGVLLALIPIILVLIVWLPPRIRWIAEASAANRIRLDAEDLHLFALRAIARRTLNELRSAAPDPAGAYASGNYEPLAALELDALGLRTVRS